MPTGFAISRPIQARRTREIDDGIGIVECKPIFKMLCIEFSLAKNFSGDFSRILTLCKADVMPPELHEL